MAKIITSVTGMHEHYLTACFANQTMTPIGSLLITQAGTVTGQSLSSLGYIPTLGVNTKIFVSVDTITHIAAPIGLTVMSAPTTAITRVGAIVPGTGYTNGAAVTAVAGTGSGFTGTAVVVNGAVTDVLITNSGSYTVAPTSFTVAGGSGCTIGAGVLGTGLALGTSNVITGAPVDSIFPVQNAGAWTVYPGYGYTVNLTTAQPGVTLTLWALDETASLWFDLGMNYQDGLSMDDGMMTSPVARGWNATDHAKRIPTANSFHINQLYCSQFEGVANLRGKTLMIKDEIHTDGGATVKETQWILKATVQNVNTAIGGGGGNHAADAVNCTGYYSRSLTATWDQASLTASL